MKRLWRVAFVILSATVSVALAADIARRWPALERDGVHDPKSPALHVLQQPSEALSQLPPDGAGNQVNWIEALERGHITPRTNILPETNVRVLETDILLNLRGSTPIVRFPHRGHTIWLDCTNCHEHLFKSQAGANKLSMQSMLQGEQCGLCHGAVAFPMTECRRCHSVEHEKPLAATPR